MGEIEMWEQWRKVGEGQGERGREVQHADVSAVANETDTAIRGTTGEGRGSAAKPDRRLEEQATGLDTPRGRGSEKVLERHDEQGTRSERTGTYVRTRGDVLRRTITERQPGGATGTDRRVGEQTTGLQTPGSCGSDEGQAGHSGQGQRPGRAGTEVRTRRDVLRQKKTGQGGSGRRNVESKFRNTKRKKSKNRKKKKSRNRTGGYAD